MCSSSVSLGRVVADGYFEAVEWEANENCRRDSREVILTSQIRRVEIIVQLHPGRMGGGFVTLHRWHKPEPMVYPFPIGMTQYSAYLDAKRSYNSDLA